MTEQQYPDADPERVPAAEAAPDTPVQAEYFGMVEKPFRRSLLTYITLLFLLILWPAMSVFLVGDPVESLKLLSLSPIFFVYIPTIIIQWLIFALIYLTTYREQTGLKGIGFQKIRLIDFLWAIAFLLVSNLLLTFIAYGLKLVGLEIPGELELILPRTTAERILWIILSLTAGVCEEAAFRGYLITRLKLVGRMKGWLLPVLIASLAFGSGHTYQGAGGFLLLTIYGAMFALLYLRTKSLWPPIIAHFFQDFSALFFPFQR